MEDHQHDAGTVLIQRYKCLIPAISGVTSPLTWLNCAS